MVQMDEDTISLSFITGSYRFHFLQLLLNEEVILKKTNFEQDFVCNRESNRR
jgi:hypothetical protein